MVYLANIWWIYSHWWLGMVNHWWSCRWGCPNSWLVSVMEHPNLKWIFSRGTPYFRKPPNGWWLGPKNCRNFGSLPQACPSKMAANIVIQNATWRFLGLTLRPLFFWHESRAEEVHGDSRYGGGWEAHDKSSQNTQNTVELHEGRCAAMKRCYVYLEFVADIGSRLDCLDWLHQLNPSSFWHSDGAGLVFVSIFGLKATLLFIVIGCTLHSTKHIPIFMSWRWAVVFSDRRFSKSIPGRGNGVIWVQKDPNSIHWIGLREMLQETHI